MDAKSRKNNISRLLAIFRRQKQTILLPMIAITTATAWFAWQLPNAYESTTVLTISPLKVAPLGTNLPEYKINHRLFNMLEENFSRSTLNSLIAKQNLFKEERANGTAAEDLTEKIYTGVKIEVGQMYENEVTSFRISYRDLDRENSIAITSALAEKFADPSVGANDTSDTLKVTSYTNLPELTITPKRLKYIVFGFGGSLILGLMLAAFSELRRLYRNQSADFS